MKAISAPPTGVDAADRAERGLGPFGTLGCPIYPRHPYLPKGAKGGRARWPSAVLVLPPARRGLRSTQRTELSGAWAASHPLGHPIFLRHSYLPKGAKGGGVTAALGLMTAMARSQDTPQAITRRTCV